MVWQIGQIRLWGHAMAWPTNGIIGGGCRVMPWHDPTTMAWPCNHGGHAMAWPYNHGGHAMAWPYNNRQS